MTDFPELERSLLFGYEYWPPGTYNDLAPKAHVTIWDALTLEHRRRWERESPEQAAASRARAEPVPVSQTMSVRRTAGSRTGGKALTLDEEALLYWCCLSDSDRAGSRMGPPLDALRRWRARDARKVKQTPRLDGFVTFLRRQCELWLRA